MDLHPGEHVIYEGHPSWRSILRVYFLGLIVVAADPTKDIANVRKLKYVVRSGVVRPVEDLHALAQKAP